MTVIETALLNEARLSGDAGAWTAAEQSPDPGVPDGAPEFRSVLRDPKRLAVIVGVSIAIVLAATLVVMYTLGSVVHDRDQRALLTTERAAINDAATANEGLYRPVLPDLPPAKGSLVGIVAIPALGLQQAVVEGAGPSQTIAAVGHEPGTSGLGQPGNSAVVGRSTGYGGPFGNLHELRPGDEIITATTEGQSVYVVSSVKTVTLVTPGTASSQSTTTTTGASSTGASSTSIIQPSDHSTGGTSSHELSTATVFGTSTHNQLTLVTSAGGAPWNSTSAVVVVAKLRGTPYEATPQEARTVGVQGTSRDGSAVPWVLLGLLVLIGLIVGASELYQRLSLRSAYLLSTAPLLVVTFLTAEAASRLLPAWV